MANTVKITGKLFPEIGSIEESAGFVDYTDAQMQSVGYTRAYKTIEIDGSVVALAATDNEGKGLIVEATGDAALAYLQTVFTGTGDADTNVYILSVERDFGVADSYAAADYTTGDYVAHKDVFIVKLRLDTAIS